MWVKKIQCVMNAFIKLINPELRFGFAKSVEYLILMITVQDAYIAKELWEEHFENMALFNSFVYRINFLIMLLLMT